MRSRVTVRRPEAPIAARITLPPSKSVANRALVLAALAGDLQAVHGLGSSDDVRTLHQLLRDRPAVMHCGDGGTTFRFLLAWAAVQDGSEHVITGNPHLLQRPHAPLIDALRALGADISEAPDGFRVRGSRMRGGTVRLHAPASSQYISALLLVASAFTEGLALHWTGLRLSEPYVQMTLRLCARFGAQAEVQGDVIRMAPARLRPVRMAVPADRSAAAFWHEVAALAPGARLLLAGVQEDGLQGDAAATTLWAEHVRAEPHADGLALEGLPHGPAPAFTADLRDTPDLFQPLAFTLAALGSSARFTGLHNLPLKETDRLKAVADALHALDCRASFIDGTFQLEGPIANLSPPPFDPQGDHRMAMSLAPLALACEAITILDPEVVNKSYPGFWEELERAGFGVRRA